jgi:uroporphyrinogen decarboxylase
VNHWQRLQAAILGNPTDRVPVAMWRHFPDEDLDPEKLAGHMIAWQRKWDCDLVKYMPSGTYGVEDWGAVTAYRGTRNGAREVIKPGVSHYEDWTRLPDLDVRVGSYGRQNQALAATAKALGGQAPILQTIFSPLTTARKLSSEALFAHMRCRPEAVHQGLQIITDVTIRFALAAIESGADGVFFASQLSTYRLLQRSEYESFGRAYDLKVLDALRGKAKFNMLHVHGEDIMFDLMSGYPVEMFNWHDRLTEPAIGQAKEHFPGLVVGGINEHGTLVHGSIEDIEREVRDAIAQTGGRRVMIAPGCVLPVAATDERLAAVVRAAHSVAVS